MARSDPEDREDGVRPGRIAWFSIFVSGVVVGLIVGLGLTPSGYASAAREVAQFSNLCGAPTDQPMTPATPTTTVVASAPLAGTLALASPAGAAMPRPISRPAPPSPAFAPISGAEHPLTIGVFGDSLADGLWTAVYRQMREGKHVDVVKLSQVATGLTRYDYVNIQAKTEAQLAKQHVDVAVILFGANDQQGIVENGKVFAFGTPGWREIYARRIDTLVATLRRQGATVYWVGLPKMRAEGFDKRAQLLNSVYQAQMTTLGVRFIPTDGATEDVHGAYAAYLPVGSTGKMTLMRANDGVHLSMPGYLRIAAPVTASIRADLEQRARGGAEAAAEPGR